MVELRRLLVQPNEQDSENEAEKEDSSSSYEFSPGRYTAGEVYPASEEEWDLKQSSVYPNLTGADADQIQQAIDTLLNFAPLTELATALEDPGFAEET